MTISESIEYPGETPSRNIGSEPEIVTFMAPMADVLLYEGYFRTLDERTFLKVMDYGTGGVAGDVSAGPILLNL
jgi:hypothetical protein